MLAVTFLCAIDSVSCWLAVLIDSLPGQNDTTYMVVSSYFYFDSLLRLWLDQFSGLHR